VHAVTYTDNTTVLFTNIKKVDLVVRTMSVSHRRSSGCTPDPWLIATTVNTAGKKKVELSLCLTKHHAMKTYRGVEVWLHAFLASAALPQRKSPRYIMDRRLSGPQSRSGIHTSAFWTSNRVQRLWKTFEGDFEAVPEIPNRALRHLHSSVLEFYKY
jgi:hypothetical protein